MTTLKALNSKISTPSTPDPTILETFTAPSVDIIEFSTSEFTSLCPVTGQPDFVEVVIKYCPNDFCVESKSLKLYLQSFRNFQGFIESLCAKIHGEIWEVLKPHWLNVTLTCTPRGGLSLKAEKDRGNLI